MSPPFAASTALTHRAVQHGFFGRTGGVSQGIYDSLNCGPGSADDLAYVTQNRQLVAKALGGGTLYTVHQHHSPDCLTMTGEEDPADRPKADAMVTDQPGLLLGVLTADCGPVLLADPVAGIVGAAHAGWRGATGGVLDNTVKAMQALGAEPNRIHAALGPTIGLDAYEVGDDFVSAVTQADPLATDFVKTRDDWPKPHFDLPGYIGARLTGLGVGQVDLSCARSTYADPARYFSYRYNGHQGVSDYGRMIAVIGLEKQE